MQIDLNKQERWIISLLVVVVVLFVVFLVTVFKRNAKSDSQYETRIAAIDSLLAEKSRVITALQRVNMEKQQRINELAVKDSILYRHILTGIDKLSQYDKEDKDIDNRLHGRNFNADSIRRAFSKY